jgi:hypothetical protein
MADALQKNGSVLLRVLGFYKTASAMAVFRLEL